MSLVYDRAHGVLGQLEAVGIRPYSQGAAGPNIKTPCRAKGLVNLGGADFLPERGGGAQHQGVVVEFIPRQG